MLPGRVELAAGARTRVTLCWDAAGVEVSVVDDGGASAVASPGGGYGLTGLRERVAAYGGTVSAGARRGTGFEVRVRLPLDRTAEVAS